MYSKETIKRFSDPQFVGEIEDADGVGEVGNMKCGDVMKMFIKVKDDVITDIKFKTYGCMAAIAASDMMCELAKGKKIDDALKITAKEITKDLGDLPPVKFHCSILGTHALKKAVEDYKSKQKA